MNKQDKLNSNDEVYHPNNIPLFETIYGKHLISLGGTAAIDNMFSDVNINNLTALDIGFGLGGVAFYLTKKYQLQITGIEIHPWMVEYAKANAPTDIANQLEFINYDSNGQIPVKSHSFDLAYSKGVLNHVKEKQPLFTQIHSVLKPNGLFVIADWTHPHAEIKPEQPLVKETQETYWQALKNSGFNDIRFRDDSLQFLNYTQLLLDNLNKQREKFIQQFDLNMFEIIIDDHKKLLADIKSSNKFAVRILAKK